MIINHRLMALAIIFHTSFAMIAENPCDDENTCHHQCELEKMVNETSAWYNVWCHCFEGFEFSGKFSNSGYELCEPKCKPGYYWDTDIEVPTCVEVLSECQVFKGHDDTRVTDEEKNDYPNIKLIGRGYDLMIGDPYSEISDSGLKSPIFSPFAKVRGNNICHRYGYDMDKIGYAKCDDRSKTFKSSKELYTDFESFVSEANTYEEGTIRVTDTSSARTSADITDTDSSTIDTGVGTSSSENLNYGRGGGISENKEVGVGHTGATNSDTNECSTDSNTADNSVTGGKTQSKQVSQSNTVSRSQSKSVDLSFSSGSENCKTSSKSAGASVGWGPFSANVETSSGTSKCQTSQSSTSISTEGTEGAEETEGTEEGTELSFSATSGSSKTKSNEKCLTAGKSNSVEKRLSKGSASNSDWRLDQSKTIGKTSNINTQVQATRSQSRGSSQEKGKNLEYEIRGFKQSFVGTTSFSKSETLIKSASGSVSVSNSVARQYGAKMKKDRPPFTADFVKEIQYLNAQTLLVGEYDGGDAEVTQRFDEIFIEFIRTYGTHFPTEIEMGSRRFSQMRFNEEETQSLSDESRESCVQNLLNDGKKGTDGETCKVPSRGSVKIDNQSISRSTKASYGSTKIGKSCEDWFHHLVPDKSVRITTKLQPITTLFTREFMPRSKITMEDGSRIEVEKISGWFLLRYLSLCRFVDKIYVGKSEQSSIKAECKNRENSCSLWSGCKLTDACVIDPKEPKGYKCVDDPCATSGCNRPFQKCIPDGNVQDYYRCETKDFCLQNPCKSTETCTFDFSSRDGYVCLDKCSQGACGEFQECIYDNTKTLGYRCEDMDLCAEGVCEPHEKCENDKYSRNGYRCTDICLLNPCSGLDLCAHDHRNPRGFKCINQCEQNPCKEHVETCYPDNDPDGIGYYCSYNGCPTDTNLCENESDGTICVNDQFSVLGYECRNPCESNPCKEHVEKCHPDSDPYGPGYYCSFTGCPHDYNVCGIAGYPEGYKCEDDQYGDYGYNCVDPCEYNSCREHVETCTPSEYDPKGYRCEYTGCPYYDICDGSQCQENVNSVAGYECNNPCDSNPCREDVEECKLSPNDYSGYLCHFTGCPVYRVCPRGQKCVADEYELKGYYCT